MRTNKQLARMTSLLTAAALLLAACGGSGNTTGGNAGSSPAQPATGATTAPAIQPQAAVGGELIYQNPEDPDTLAYWWRSSSYAANVLQLMYGDGLLRIGTDYQPTPALAEAMPEVSADGTTYTFKIRKGVKFHDGHELTAEDVAFTYETLLSPDYAGGFRSNVAQVESVTVLDPYTVQIKTKGIFAPFLFSAATLPAMPKHTLGAIPVKDMAKADAWMVNPVGSGPYKFVEWKTGQYVTLERFADYYRAGESGENGGKIGPWPQTVRFKTIPEDATAMAAMEAGEISLLTRQEGDNADRLKQEYEGKMQMFEWNRMGYGYQTFNNDKFPTNIKEFRQALSYGLNRANIVAGLLNGQGTVPPGFVPPIHWVYDSSVKGYEYSPEKAVQLIEKAGFKKNAQGMYEKDGQPAKLKYVATKGSALVEGIALAAQKDWKKIGVEVEVMMVEFNTLLEKHLQPGDFHVTFSGLTFTLDPHVSFASFHSRDIRLDASGIAQGDNRARYKNARVDELIDQGMQTVDLNERRKIYQEAQRLIIDDAPMNWIYVNRYLDVAQNDLQGLVNWDGYGLSLNHAAQWHMSAK